MRISTVLAALVLSVLPGLALAQGCSHGDRVTMSCAEGTVWDADSGTCVPSVNS